MRNNTWKNLRIISINSAHRVIGIAGLRNTDPIHDPNGEPNREPINEPINELINELINLARTLPPGVRTYVIDIRGSGCGKVPSGLFRPASIPCLKAG